MQKASFLNPSIHIHNTSKSQSKFHDVVLVNGLSDFQGVSASLLQNSKICCFLSQVLTEVGGSGGGNFRAPGRSGQQVAVFLSFTQSGQARGLRDAGCVYQTAVKSAQNLYRHGRSALIYLFLLRVGEFSKIP